MKKERGNSRRGERKRTRKKGEKKIMVKKEAYRKKFLRWSGGQGGLFVA